MHLTKEEERIYEGEEGWTKKKAMEILVAIGDINNASELIPIASAHMSGVSYKTIGDAFEFINRLEGTVKVKSTLNPMGMDRELWTEMNISEEFANKQTAVFTARAIKQRMQELVRKIENYGVKVICDTCFVVSPAFERYKCVLTNSGKMMRYVPRLCGGAEVRLCKT